MFPMERTPGENTIPMAVKSCSSGLKITISKAYSYCRATDMAPEDSGFHANPDSVFMNSNRPAWGRESDHQLSETPGIHSCSDWTGNLRLASSPTSLLPGIHLSFFVLSRKTGPS